MQYFEFVDLYYVLENARIWPLNNVGVWDDDPWAVENLHIWLSKNLIIVIPWYPGVAGSRISYIPKSAVTQSPLFTIL